VILSSILERSPGMHEMRAVFEKLPSTTLRGRIAEKMQQAILTCVLQEGEKLVERKLAAQFETSLTAVREALIQLEAEGFVTKKPNAATYVTKLSADSSEKIFVVRNILETHAIAEAARLATGEQVRQLENSYLELLDTARSENAQIFILKDLGLHERIWEIADNEYLEIALRRIVHPIFAFSAIRILSGRAFDLLQDAQSHLPIVEAIKSKNPEAARKAFLAASQEWLVKTRAYVFGQSESG
jgi:DNA-binding GntR family transcriptional regulator